MWHNTSSKATLEHFRILMRMQSVRSLTCYLFLLKEEKIWYASTLLRSLILIFCFFSWFFLLQITLPSSFKTTQGWIKKHNNAIINNIGVNIKLGNKIENPTKTEGISQQLRYLISPNDAKEKGNCQCGRRLNNSQQVITENYPKIPKRRCNGNRICERWTRIGHWENYQYVLK